MVYPVGRLQQMEYALYGGMSGLNSGCPSYLNGYRGNSSMLSSYYPYYNQNYTARQNNNQSIQGASRGDTYQRTNDSVGFGASQSDLEVLKNYYSKQSAPSESLTSAAVGGAAFSLLTNLRFIVHPWNSLTSLPTVEKMFAGVKQEGSTLFNLWKNPDTHQIMTDAYYRMHKLEGGAMSRLPLFKTKLDSEVVTSLREEMRAALESGNTESIAKVSEKIKVATDYKNGYIVKGWRWLKGKLGFNGETVSVAEKLASEEANIAASAAQNLTEKASMSLTQHLKHGIKGQGGIGGALMMGIEFLMDWGKIKSAFNKDSETGMKQLGQTTVKGLGTLVGWTAGEAVGAWGGAKLGAYLGTAISPGLGTAIGAISGLVMGSIGCWLTGKLTHAIVGKDVGEKAELEAMTKTPQGQMQLLQQTMQMAQNDKKIDQRTIQAMQNVYNAYA